MRLRSTFAAVAMIALLAANASAAFSIDSLSNVGDPPPVGGTQAWPGQMGDDFLVGPKDLFITSIAVFDDDGDGTSTPLTWQLFEVTTGTLIHSQIVLPTANTPGATVEDNYVFAVPTAPITLLAGGQYSVVASGFNSIDTNFNTNTVNPPNIAADVDFNETDLKAFGGRYSNAPSLLLPTVDVGNSLSGKPYSFGDAAFVYAVPEASSLLVVGLGGIFAFGAVGLGKRYGISLNV